MQSRRPHLHNAKFPTVIQQKCKFRLSHSVVLPIDANLSHVFCVAKHSICGPNYGSAAPLAGEQSNRNSQSQAHMRSAGKLWPVFALKPLTLPVAQSLMRTRCGCRLAWALSIILSWRFCSTFGCGSKTRVVAGPAARATYALSRPVVTYLYRKCLARACHTKNLCKGACRKPGKTVTSLCCGMAAQAFYKPSI